MSDGTCAGGQCSSGGQCFAAGTLVQTTEGRVPIESIQVGDYVLARHEKTGELGHYRVEDTIIRFEQPLIRIAIASEHGFEEFRVTGEHPFFVLDQNQVSDTDFFEHGNWIAAKKLVVGQRLVDAQGHALVVQTLQSLPVRETVYNLTVEHAHTYFVGKHQVWTHNTCWEWLRNLFSPHPNLKTTFDSILH